MCGIAGSFYAASTKEDERGDVIARVNNLYQNQKLRGQEGFGAAVITPERRVHIYRSTEPISIAVDLRLHSVKFGHLPLGVLFHHRYPTSTRNRIEQTHPIWVSHPSLKCDYLVVHNGVIANDTEVKKIHVDAGFQYNTLDKEGKWNDSETAAIEFVKAIELPKYKSKVRGSQALVAISIDKTTRKALDIHAATNGGNPLSYYYSKEAGYFEVASELQGEEIGKNRLVSFDLEKNTLTFRNIRLQTNEFIYSPSTNAHGWGDKKTYHLPKKDKKDGKKKDGETLIKDKNQTVTVWKAKDNAAGTQAELERVANELEPLTDAPHPVERLLQDDHDELEGLIDEYYELLFDPDAIATVNVEEYLGHMRKSLHRLKAKALEYHTATYQPE